MTIYFISGHLDLTWEEFAAHYRPQIDEALATEASFVVGDARGCDAFAQSYLVGKTKNVKVYHMFEKPRCLEGSFQTTGGFMSDSERDIAMTCASEQDIAWVRPGREQSGTARNLERRKNSSGRSRR